MMNLNRISEDLFNKIRGRFPNVTIGDESGNITNEPKDARFFDFEYTEDGRSLGKVSVSLSDENRLAVIYSRGFIDEEDEATKDNWFDFLKELRRFSKKRLLDFDVRDITKTNLTKRDYKFLSQNNFGDPSMNESKLYGTGKISYQNVNNARIVIKHNENIDQAMPGARTRNISNIYIENAEGERFKYPFKHLNGARAMAQHVSEGGKPYDDFGSHITSLSEEMSKLKKFNSYMNRSSVVAEGLADYIDIVKERVKTVKKTVESLQKLNYYKEAIAGFEKPIMEEVPSDVAENWIDQLTIRQFNEELKDVFPYIYNLVSEATKAKALGPDDLVEFNVRVSKLHKPAGEYNHYDIFVGTKKVGNQYIALALRGNKEIKDLRGGGNTPNEAVEAVKSKIDDIQKKAEKITSNATINLNVNFVREELPGSTVAIEPGDAFYAKLDKGPSLVIANEDWGDDAREFDFQKVSYKKLKSDAGQSFTGAVFAQPAAKISALNLVKHGRYLLGSPTRDSDNNYVFPMSYHSVAAASNDPLKLGKPALGVNPLRATEAVESQSSTRGEDKKPKTHSTSRSWEKAMKKNSKAKVRQQGKKDTRSYEEMIEAGFEEMMGEWGNYPDGMDHNQLDGYDVEHAWNEAQAEIKFAVKEHDVEILKDIGDPANYDKEVIPDLLADEASDLVYDLAPHFKERVFDAIVDDMQEYALKLLTQKFRQVIGQGESVKEGMPAEQFAALTKHHEKMHEIHVDKANAAKAEGNAEAQQLHKEAARQHARATNALNMQTQDAVEKSKAATALSRQLKAEFEGAGKGENVPAQPQVSLSEFILSYFDRHTGQFPKGKTSVLTMVEKDYGEEFIEPAKQFIEMINNKVAEMQGYREADISEKYRAPTSGEIESYIDTPQDDDVPVIVHWEADDDDFNIYVTDKTGNEIQFSSQDEMRFRSEVNAEMQAQHDDYGDYKYELSRDQGIDEWDTDPDQEKSDRDESMDYYLDKVDPKWQSRNYSEAEAYEFGAAVEQLPDNRDPIYGKHAVISADDVVDLLDRRGQIANNEDLDRIQRLAGLR